MPTDLITPRGRRLAKYELVRLLIPWGTGAVVGTATAVALLNLTPAALPVGIVIGAGVGALVNATRPDPNSERRGPSLRRARASEHVFVVAVAIALTLSTVAWSAGHSLGAAITLCVIATTGALLGRVLWRSHPAHTVLGRFVNAAARNPRNLLAGVAGALLVAGGFAAAGFEVARLPLAIPCGLIVLAAAVKPQWTAAKDDGQTIDQVRAALTAAVKDESLFASVSLDSFAKPAEIHFKMPTKFSAAQEDQIKEDCRQALSHWSQSWQTSLNWSFRTVTISPVGLPEFIVYPGSRQPWNRFPLGVLETGEEAFCDVLEDPHLLLCGPTGTGKTAIQRNLVFHALQHPEEWSFVGIDLKRGVELGPLEGLPGVLTIAKDLDDAVTVLRTLKDECDRRYDEMDAAGVNNISGLSHAPKRLLVMIDENSNLMDLEGAKTDEGKERDRLKAEAKFIVGYLLRTARACGIHLVVAMQRPDATILSGEMKNNLPFRIAAGRMSSTSSRMVLDSDDATKLPKVKGRGLIQVGEEARVFQGYFAEQKWITDYFASKAVLSIDQSTTDGDSTDDEPLGDVLEAQDLCGDDALDNVSGELGDKKHAEGALSWRGPQSTPDQPAATPEGDIAVDEDPEALDWLVSDD